MSGVSGEMVGCQRVFGGGGAKGEVIVSQGGEATSCIKYQKVVWGRLYVNIITYIRLLGSITE